MRMQFSHVCFGVRACLNCCGSVMLAVVSGNEFQSFIVRGKINKKICKSSYSCAGEDGVEGFTI